MGGLHPMAGLPYSSYRARTWTPWCPPMNSLPLKKKKEKKKMGTKSRFKKSDTEYRNDDWLDELDEYNKEIYEENNGSFMKWKKEGDSSSNEESEELEMAEEFKGELYNESNSVEESEESSTEEEEEEPICGKRKRIVTPKEEKELSYIEPPQKKSKSNNKSMRDGLIDLLKSQKKRIKIKIAGQMLQKLKYISLTAKTPQNSISALVTKEKRKYGKDAILYRVAPGYVGLKNM